MQYLKYWFFLQIFVTSSKWKVISPIISLLITFGILYDLSQVLIAIEEGNRDSNLFLRLVFESIGLFIIPFFFKTTYRSQNANQNSKKSQQEQEKFRLKLKKRIQLDEDHQKVLLSHCPFCGFELRSGNKMSRCPNCGHKLSTW